MNPVDSNGMEIQPGDILFIDDIRYKVSSISENNIHVSSEVIYGNNYSWSHKYILPYALCALMQIEGADNPKEFIDIRFPL